MDEPIRERAHPRRETVAVLLLAVTAVLTAWSGFEASQWSGETSISFSQASTQRLQAARDDAEAEAARSIDLQVFAVYLQAMATGDDRLAQFAQARFTPHFAVAFDEWIAQHPLTNPDAARSPFALDSYVPPGQEEAKQADEQADALFAQALEYDQRGDDYTLVTVLFALVLFLGAVANRFADGRLAWGLLAGAGLLLCVGIALLASFPRLT